MKPFLSNKRKKTANAVISLIVVCITGYIDYIIGYEISFSLFYLIPIAFISWYNSKAQGIIISVISAAVWLAADFSAGLSPSHFAISLWNASVRLGFFITVAILLSSLKNSYRTEKKLSRIDYLTGIGNSRHFYEQALKEINASARYKNPISIVYIDLDNFKEMNDLYGHLKGDELLKIVADTITNNLRITDTVSRLGGDEFAVLLPYTGFENSKSVLKKIQLNLLEIMAENGWTVTFSIGAATFINPPQTVEELIKKADDLMYCAKNDGKNTVRYELY